ncbi:MAG: GDSL-type esterase/lipase family protein [Acidobacteriota bacterium]
MTVRRLAAIGCLSMLPCVARADVVAGVYLAFGDSITAGFDDSQGYETGGYTNYLGPRLQADDPTAVLINGGKSGEQAAQAGGRLEEHLNADRPQVTLLMEGINDLRNGYSASSTAASVETLIQRCINHGSIPIVATILPDDAEVPRGQIASANGSIIAFTGDGSVIGLNDAFAVFVEHPEYIGITHPNQAGYQVLADLWYQAIQTRGKNPPPTGVGNGDLDHDGLVDGADLIRLALAFGTSFGEAGYDYGADVNGDGIVDGTDLSILTSNFGRSVS